MAEPRIPLTRPLMDEREADAARRAILSGWVTQGAEVGAFETEFAAAVGAPHACAVSSCTAALHLALRAVGVRPGDEVVSASYSYVATANAIRHAGAIPVFADIARGSPNLSPAHVEASITPRTTAILCVHQMGLPCDLDALAAIATRHGLPLVEDAACAAGSDVLLDGRWQRVGSPRGDVCCFSFHPRKLLTTGDGGMLTTRRADLDHAFRLGRQHGMSVSDRARHASPHVVDEAHVTLGYNYRMTDVQAAIGRVQLARLPLILERRRRLAGRYRTLLTSLPVAVPAVPHWAHPNWQSFWIELPAGCDRPALMQQLLDEGIATRRGIRCAHLEPAYATEPWKAGPGGLTESERASDRSLVLPLYPQMTDAEQDEVAAGLAAALTGVAIE